MSRITKIEIIGAEPSHLVVHYDAISEPGVAKDEFTAVLSVVMGDLERWINDYPDYKDDILDLLREFVRAHDDYGESANTRT